MPAVTTPPYRGATVSVRAINSTADLVCKTDTICKPRIPGHESLNLPTVVWLIEHGTTKTNVLFDCGVRKDFHTFSSTSVKVLQSCVPHMHVPYDVRDVLDRNEISCDGLASIIWSHHHFDHIGDASRFPNSAEIVVGPGFKRAFLPGWPTRDDSPIPAADIVNKSVREVVFEDDLRIGGLRAYDFWGDGSLYLLDTPGHSIGHISALARTTETDFIFMGGDICHFPGSFRPSADIPLPHQIPEASLDNARRTTCLATAFTCYHQAGSEKGLQQPFYNVSDYESTIYADPVLADATVRHLMDFDASPNVLVAIGHDPGIPALLPMLNIDATHTEALDDWRSRGLKERVHWDFLNELPLNGRPGREPLVEGYVSEGEIYKVDAAKMALIRADVRFDSPAQMHETRQEALFSTRSASTTHAVWKYR